MKISEMIDLLIYYKKEFGDINVAKCGSFIGSETIDSAFVYENQLVLIDSEQESYLSKFIKGDLNVL